MNDKDTKRGDVSSTENKHMVIGTLAERLLKESKLLREQEPFVYLLPKQKNVENFDKKIRKYELGERPAVPVHEKVILLVGETGTGKTTLVDSMFNFLLGVTWETNFRFKICDELENLIEESVKQAESQTQFVTAYTVNQHECQTFTQRVTVVDTPGFGDTSGLEKDMEILEVITNFFKTKGKEGIDHVNAVGFTVQAPRARLTPSQQFIFDSILGLFGSDIADKIFLMVTFADSNPPSVLSAAKAASVPYRKMFKFNNSVLFSKWSSDSTAPNKDSSSEDGQESDEDNDDSINQLVWNMGKNSFQKFFQYVSNASDCSLQLSRDVLKEREQLEFFASGVHEELKISLDYLDRLKTEVNLIREHQLDIDANMEFTYEAKVGKLIKASANGKITTTCLRCNFTCHYKCPVKEDEEKYKCLAMKDGFCRICPQKCKWQDHKNTDYRYYVEYEMQTKTSTDIEKRYRSAEGKKFKSQSIINELNEEFQAVQLSVIASTNKIHECMKRLDEIALRPQPANPIKYIDILIEAEQKQRNPGWKKTVEHLKEAKEMAINMFKITKGKTDPFKEYNEKRVQFLRQGIDSLAVIRQLAENMKEEIEDSKGDK